MAIPDKKEEQEVQHAKQQQQEGRMPYLRGSDGMIYPYDRDIAKLPGMTPWKDGPPTKKQPDPSSSDKR